METENRKPSWVIAGEEEEEEEMALHKNDSLIYGFSKRF